MSASDVVVVIPSHVDIDWSLLSDLPPEIPVIVVDDSETGLAPAERDNVRFLGRRERDEIFGPELAAGLPRRSAASRNTGHAVALAEGYRVVIALDNDCRPGPGWVGGHLAALQPRTSHPAVAGTWINSIDGTGCYARGYPYEFRTAVPETTPSVASGDVKLNVGLWTGVLDLNGIDKVGVDTPSGPGPSGDRTTVALGSVPMCGMNLAIAADVIPALFFLPDVWFGGWQMSRHDDIWGGYIAEKLIAIRGDLVCFGQPLVEHTRQTPLDRVTVLEHYMHLAGRHFYDIVDQAAEKVVSAGYEEMFAHFCAEFDRALHVARLPEPFRPAFSALAGSMRNWSACLAALGRTR